MDHKKGKFIVFEGIDGSGKSTQIKFLSKKLKDQGVKVYETFEPTDSPIGSLIRQMMKGRIHSDNKVIAALFIADRLDHLLNEVDGILKKINEGVTVISDRYYFSSYAYHGAHMPIEWVINGNSLSAEILRPDINIFLDISPEESLKRINNNRWHLELYENLENMKKVREKYMQSFEMLKDVESIVSIDADNTPEKIAEDVWNVVKKLYE